MSINLLYYNMYEEDGTSELEDPISVSTYEELSKLIKSNYFCVNLIQKLFTNLKVNEIMIGSHNEEYLYKEIYDKLEKENYAKYRNQLVDLSLILYSSVDDELNRNLNIISTSDSDNIFDRTFLGLELILLKKVQYHYKKSIFSKYSERLIDLSEKLTNKKFSDINIDEYFIEKIVNHQLEKAQSFNSLKSKIDSYSKRLSIIDAEITRLNNDIKQLIQNHQKQSIAYDKKIEELKETKKKFVEERFTIFDKTKILFFEILGFEHKVESVFEKRQNNLKGTFFSRLEEEEQQLVKNENERKSFVTKKATELKKHIDNGKTVKISLSKQIYISKEEIKIIEQNLLSTDTENILNNNVDILNVKSLSTLSKENIVFVHVFPRFYDIANSPLEEYVEMVDRGNIIRIFNPKLECNVYPLIGADFSRELLNKTQGDYGVLLSRGVVEQINKVNENNKEEIKDHFLFKEKVRELNSYTDVFYEALVDKSELYGFVAIIDNMIKKETDKKIKVSKLIEAFEYLHKFNQHGIKNQLRELPMIFMICGEILEIKGLKFDKYKLNQKQKEMKLDKNQALVFIKKTFLISKQLNKTTEITLKKDTISDKVREECATSLLHKFKTYFVNNFKESIDNKLGKKTYSMQKQQEIIDAI